MARTLATTLHVLTVGEHWLKLTFVATCCALPPQKKMYPNAPLNQIAIAHFCHIQLLAAGSNRTHCTTIAKSNLARFNRLL